MQRSHRWSAVATAGALMLLLGSTAGAQDVSGPFLGSYETTGTYSNQRNTKVELRVERGADGKLTVTRTGRYTSRRYRNLPPFTWKGEARVEGNALKVTYKVNPDGTPYVGTGITDVLTNPNGTTPGTNPPAAPTHNVFEATYALDASAANVEERLVNTTRRSPEHWWTGITTKGPRLSAPPTPVTPPVTPPAVQTGRVKLGGELALTGAEARINVIVPTDGTLVLKVTAGTVSLEGPNGQATGPAAAAEVKLDIGHQTPVLGAYTAVVKNASAGAKLTATFVQDGRIDPRIRPWSSHTYYPINGEGWGGGENTNSMFFTGGPLEKFDKALGLTGKQSALWWEKGTDYRTGFGFERGHYTRVSSPTEKAAERDWYADLDGDGTIEKEDATAAFKRFDANGDGKATREEVKEQLYKGAVKALWAAYDKNGDEKVDATEIFASFVTQNDKNNDGSCDFAEWDAGLRRSFDSTLKQRTDGALAALMRKDGNSDGLTAEEMGPVGAVDFQDSSDVDGDFNSFFDRDNVSIHVDGTRHFGNKLVEEGGKVKLFKGRKQDQLVIEADVAHVTSRETGIADGDLDDSYSVGWWGHCNAWSMAAIVFRKPAAEFTSSGQSFSVRDQKSILVEYGMGDTEDSTFWWQQWGGEDIPADKYAAGFHRQMHRWLRVEQKGMMADMDMKDPHNNLNFAVWNYPLLGYVATIKEAEGDDPYVVDVDCKMEKGSYSDDDSSSTANVAYRLHFDPSGAIKETGGKTEWRQKSGENLVFIRYLIHPFRFTGPGTSRNPNVTEERLKQVFGANLKYNNIEDLPTPPANNPGLPPPGQ